MVSFHQMLAGSPITTEIPSSEELELASSKKRKWEEPPLITEELFFKDQSASIEESNLEKRKSIFDIELNLRTPPLPSHKWKQYLTIQSGQLHLCNTKTNLKEADSKIIITHHEPQAPSCGSKMSLDLELNLTCESSPMNDDDHIIIEKKRFDESSNKYEKHLSLPCGGITRSPSWLSIEGDDHKEMVATVCMRCHMLVMLCKSSPSCPNCKFMHPPPDQNPSKFLMKRRRCSLFC